MKRVAIMGAIAIATFGIANAADKNGNFMMGGSAGGVSCPSFLDSMATARQAGGTRSPAGAGYVWSYVDFVEGFRTGFNSENRGIFDIFAPLEVGEERGFAVLYAIEPWCAQHPEAKFADAVLALAKTLSATAQ